MPCRCMVNAYACLAVFASLSCVCVFRDCGCFFNEDKDNVTQTSSTETKHWSPDVIHTFAIGLSHTIANGHGLSELTSSLWQRWIGKVGLYISCFIEILIFSIFSGKQDDQQSQMLENNRFIIIAYQISYLLFQAQHSYHLPRVSTPYK